MAVLEDELIETIEVDMYYCDPRLDAPEMRSDQPAGEQIKPDFHRVKVRNARAIADELSLDREGFILARHAATVAFEEGFVAFNLDRKRDVPEINRRYADEIVPLIARLSSGDLIVPQPGRMTLRATPRTGLAPSDATASLVHLDYSPRAVADAIALTFRLEGKPVPAYRRVALYQTWRVLTPPPHDSVLAICDTRTVSDDAAIVLQTHNPPTADNPEVETIEVRLCTYEAKHRWYWFKDMTPDELLVFKGYDSDCPGSATGAHIAFDNPLADRPNGRISIEARFLVFYD